MKIRPIAETTVFVVSSRGNMQALTGCLTSIALQHLLPGEVVIRLEGEIMGLSNFYFEQAVDLLRVMGVRVFISCAQSKGVRAARSELVDAVEGHEYIWMGDDDCVYDANCLSELLVAKDEALKYVRDDTLLGWVQGSKPDVNNRRGYKDFSIEIREGQKANNDEGYNFFFTGPGKTVLCSSLDTGNVLYLVQHIKERMPKTTYGGDNQLSRMFNHMDVEYNSSGEDTLCALFLRSRNLFGVFRTSANCVHMEKQVGGFDEFSARKNYITAVAELNGYDATNTQSVLPWVK